jgi:hypothetical protein
MSRRLKFYGASDDLFEIEGTFRNEPGEIGCFDSPAVVKVWSPSEGELAVVAMYAPAGVAACWSIGIMPVDDDIPIPSWQMDWSADGYTTELALTVPDDAVVSEMFKVVQ